MGTVFQNDTELLYDSWCNSNQGQAIDNSIEHLIRTILEPRRGERILDIGCGTGNHMLLLKKMGMEPTGVDASSHMLKKARERLDKRFTLKMGWAEDLPFDDNEFDYAVMINTLEFLNDPIQALMEAGRVSSKSIFIGAINALSWNGIGNRIQGLLGNPLFKNAKFYNLFQLKSFILQAYGDVPVSWLTVQCQPSFIKGLGSDKGVSSLCRRSPFGSFIAISARMLYRLKTDNLPLRVRLKKAAPPLVGSSTIGDINANRGVSGE